MVELDKTECVSGYEAYGSPEFQAFCKKFKIEWGLPTKEITIRLTVDEIIVTQVYPGRIEKKPETVDTTDMHNVDLRTCGPPLDVAYLGGES